VVRRRHAALRRGAGRERQAAPCVQRGQEASAQVGPIAIEDARRLFAPERAYLDTATYGLPPQPAWDALRAAEDEWRHGRTSFEGWQLSADRARATFARLVGADAADVAIGPQVSPLTGLVAASLEPGARVVCAQEDFTSVLFPLLAQEARGVRVECVPLDALTEAIDGRTALVAVSAVQSADGRVVDLDALVEAARHHGARTFIDATQAIGWLPFDATRFDYVACAGYKWLLNPRGTAWLYARAEAAADLVPHAANWFAGDEPTTYYGPPLRLARDARRFDISPAWMAWVGGAPALELLEAVGIEAIHAHDVGLANRFRAGMGLEPGDSAMVSLDVPAGADERLRAAGVAAAGRGGRMRFAFHLSTSEADVDRALSALQV
jgi:selenocysteine lyase/cysteine desulfurase